MRFDPNPWVYAGVVDVDVARALHDLGVTPDDAARRFPDDSAPPLGYLVTQGDVAPWVAALLVQSEPRFNARGRRLRTLAHARDVQLQTLASELGSNTTALWRWLEHGDSPARRLSATSIASTLGVPVDALDARWPIVISGSTVSVAYAEAEGALRALRR